MADQAAVDYGEVGDDFTYFVRHSNESLAQVTALSPHMTALVDNHRAPSMLDFGCGDGTFGSLLFGALGSPSERIDLSLAEPVDDHLALAVSRMGPLVRSVATIPVDLVGQRGGLFDLILANHCLYYVSYPLEILTDLMGQLASDGVLIAPMLDQQNALARVWQAAFQAMGEPFPFFLAGDIEALAQAHDLATSRDVITYRIDFPDSSIARTRVLRFLLGDHLQKLDTSTAQVLFDGHAKNGRVVLETSYPQLVIGRQVKP